MRSSTAELHKIITSAPYVNKCALFARKNLISEPDFGVRRKNVRQTRRKWRAVRALQAALVPLKTVTALGFYFGTGHNRIYIFF